MPDLGGDASGQVMNLMTKTLEALTSLLKTMWTSWMDRDSRLLKKDEANKVRDQRDVDKYIAKLERKAGLVKAKEMDKLEQMGVPVSTLEVCEYTKQNEAKLNEFLSREGIPYSVLTNSGDKALGEKCMMVLRFRTQDAQWVEHAINRYNKEMRLEEIDRQCNEILEKAGKGGILSDRELDQINELNKARNEILGQEKRDLNDHTGKEYTDHIIFNKPPENHDLARALNRDTGQYLTKDRTIYLVDPMNKNNYIKCHGEQAEYKGKPYLKTTYEVYKDGKLVLTADDGKADNRGKDYWYNTRQEIAAAAGFDTYYKFLSEDEYRDYTKALDEQNIYELEFIDVDESQLNFERIDTLLKGQLRESGAEMRDGVAYDTLTGRTSEEIYNDPTFSIDDRVLASESVVIVKQIELYHQMSDVKQQLIIAEANKLAARNDPEAYAAAETEYNRLNEGYSALKRQASEYIEQRKQINSIQAERRADPNLEKERQAEQNMEHEGPQRAKSMTGWSERIEALRKEKMAENARRQQEQEKANSGKSNSGKTQETKKTSKSSQSHDDR